MTARLTELPRAAGSFLAVLRPAGPGALGSRRDQTSPKRGSVLTGKCVPACREIE